MKFPKSSIIASAFVFLLYVHLARTSSDENDPFISYHNHRHRYSSINTRGNVTILHEVNDEAPIELNTHEILPVKPLKKKPYSLPEKPSDYEKIRPIKELDAHAVTFDFNLGDLEDIHHETIKKGDLSLEERHLLRNDNDEGLTYTENVLVELTTNQPAVATTTNSFSESAATASASTSTTTTTYGQTDTSVSPATVATISQSNASPHILKVMKNKSKIKGRELLKKEELQKTFGNHFNSISRFFGESPGNFTEESTQAGNANIFQIIINLYDHFYWQPSEIRTKVSAVCGVEILAYLTALNNNYEWAQKAYDSSGRYRGQLLYKNEKWVGQKTFCLDVNRKNTPNERKHFEFAFYAALIRLKTRIPSNVTATIELGECLPKSCNPHDIEVILSLDPHARMLGTFSTSSSENSTQIIKILNVRSVPGKYCWWREIEFQIFAALIVTTFFVVIVATWYQADINRKKSCQSSASKAASDPRVAVNPETYNGKGFEIYQMTTMNGDNNNVDLEADLNGNKNNRSKQHEMEKAQTQTQAQVQSTGGGDFEANTKLSLHQEILLCFAFQTNAATIISVADTKDSTTSCIHGLRVFSLLWTIMVHTYLQMFAIGENRFYRELTERSIFYQFVGNATFSVDTFFFISGFLAVLLFLRQEKKLPDDRMQFMRRGIFDSFKIIFYRYIRLTPAYLFVTFFNDLSLRQTFDRSVFRQTVPSTNCTKYWWRNILYINNFYPLNEMCMMWSWYMANDMQFFIMATLLLVLSTRHFKTSALIVTAFLITSWGVAGVISIHHNYTHKVAEPFESFDFLYDKPWQRIGTYIMGMLTGYIIHTTKTPPKVSNRVNLSLWAASLGLLLLIIFGVWNGQLSVIATAFYVSVGHTAFGLGLVWIVLSCCWGLSNPVNKVLAYRGLWPLSRLTYCAYLIHPIIMLIVSFNMDGTVHLNNLLIITIFLGNAVVSFGAAFLMSIMFEAPVIRLLKICIKK